MLLIKWLKMNPQFKPLGIEFGKILPDNNDYNNRH